MKRIIFLLLAFIINASLVCASAKVIIPINKEIRISAKSWFENSQYNWSLVSKENNDILDTQNTQTYTQKFTKPWNYDLNLLIKNNNSDEVKTTTVDLAIWKSYKFFEDMSTSISTIPDIDKDWEISFSTKSWIVIYYLAWSKWVKEFHIDKDINIDSDKDWINDNDIDNINDDSFKEWTSYKVGYSWESEHKTKITLIWFNDKKEEILYKIALNKKINTNYSWDLKKIVKSLPRYNKQEKEIYVPFGINEIFIYSKDSIWDFLQYRIDTDTNVDSDWNWKKWDDIDNKNHQSLKNGSIFSIKRWEKESQIMQLTVISWKKWSWIKRKIVWWKELEVKDFSIYSSNDQALVWSDIYFWISGLENENKYPIEWDLDWDWKTDKSDTNFVKHNYEEPGQYIVKINIKDKDWKTLEARLNVEVRDKIENDIKTTKPIAKFSFKINGPHIKLSQESKVDPNLLNQEFNSLWKFWNWNISTENSPEFLYSRLWKYTIELIITDSHWKTSSMQKKIEIENLSLQEWVDKETQSWVIKIQKPVEIEPIVIKEPIKKDPIDFGSNKILIDSLKYILIFILWTVWLIFLYLIFQKIKHPDYSFWEIVEEEREKILSLIEWEPYIPPAQEIKTQVSKWIENLLENKEDEEVSDDNENNIKWDTERGDDLEDSNAEGKVGEGEEVELGDKTENEPKDEFDFNEDDLENKDLEDDDLDKKNDNVISSSTQPDWLKSSKEKSISDTKNDLMPHEFWDFNQEDNDTKLVKPESDENITNENPQASMPPPPPPPPPPLAPLDWKPESSEIKNKDNDLSNDPRNLTNKWNQSKKQDDSWPKAEIPDWLK